MARVFVYDGREFPDPDPKMSIEEVRQSMTNFFPELANADTNQSKRDENDIIEFKRRVGSKGYSLGEYPVIVKVFADRKGLNFFRWFWACTDLFQRIRVGKFKPCRLGFCEVDHSTYAGGDSWVKDMLRHGLCPHCGNQTAEKYGTSER